MAASIADFTQVVFHDIEEFLNFYEPLVCRYTVGSSLSVTSRDWIGLFKLGWRSVKEYISSEWVPIPEDYQTGKELTGSVTFKADSLPHDANEFYQFCYVSSSGKVCGASPPFQFRDGMNNFIEIDETPSMLLIQPRHRDDFVVLSNHESKSSSCQSTGDQSLLSNNSEEVERLKKEVIDLQTEVITLKADKLTGEQQRKQFNLQEAAVNRDFQSQTSLTETSDMSKLNGTLKEQLRCLEGELKKAQDNCRSIKESHTEETRRYLQEIESLKQQLTKQSSDHEVVMMNHMRAKEENERLHGEMNEDNTKLKTLVENYVVAKLEWEAKEREYVREIAQLKEQAAHAELMAQQTNNSGGNVAGVDQHTTGPHVDQAAATGQTSPNPHCGTPPQNVANPDPSGSKICPACELVFPPEIEDSFINDHFMSMHMEKICPVCDQHFPTSYEQEVFEAHVQACLMRSERAGATA